jgi:cytochrome P450
MIYRATQTLHDRWSAIPSETPIAVLPDLQELNLMAILLSCFMVDVDDKSLKEIAAAYHHCKKETELRMLGDPDPQSKRDLEFRANLRVLKDYILQMMEERRNSPSDAELPCMDALLHSGFPRDQVNLANTLYKIQALSLALGGGGNSG